MENYDFNIDKDRNKISWIYNNKEYLVGINGLKRATIIEDKYVYIINSTEDNYEQVQYYTLNGKFVFTYIGKNGLVSWLKEEKTIKLNIDELEYANIYGNYKIIAILKGEKHIERKLIIYSIDGDLICEQAQPKNYYFSYLTYDGDKPAVICEGDGKNGSRKNGRSTWKFSINSVTGELKKISLAY